MADFGDPTRWLALLATREATQLRRQELELSRQQQQLDNAFRSEQMQLSREARLESSMNSAVQRRLDETRIKGEEAQLEAWESGARLLDIFNQRFGQAQSPRELEANMAATQEVLGSSREFSGLRQIKGGVEAAFGHIGKTFTSAMDRFLASPNVGDRLDMASLVTSEGTQSNSSADPDALEKARAVPGKILAEWTGAINAMPDPKNVVDPVGGILPTDFARVGQSQIDSLKEFESRLLDPRLSTPDSIEDVAVFKSAITAKRQAWEESLALVSRVDRVREAAIRGVPVENYAAIRDDMNSYYQIFDQKMVKHAPIGQAVQSMSWYAKTGIVPDALVSDLTNPVMFDQPDSAYRASALLETLQRSGKDSTVVKITDAFKGNPKQMVLAQRINAWRDVNRGIEMQAFASGDPAVMAEVVSQAYVTSIQAMAASEQLAKGVTEDLAMTNATSTGNKQKPAEIGGVNVQIPTVLNPVSSRQVAIGLMHREIPGWTRGSIAGRFGYSSMTNEERTRLTDDFQWAYEQELAATQDEVAAWTNAESVLRKRWGDSPWGPRAGKSTPMPPKSLALEQGIALEDDIANSMARIQIHKEVIGPYNAAKGTQVAFKHIVTTPTLGIDDDGLVRTGYHVAAQIEKDGKVSMVPIADRIWFPDFRDDSVPADMIDSDDAKLLMKHYSRERSPDIDAALDRSMSSQNDELRRRDARAYKARQAYRDRPSPATLNEMRKAESLLLDFWGVPPEER